MSNYIMKNAGVNISNIVPLSVIPEDYYSDDAPKVSNKFFCSAALLPKGEFLGWQFRIGKDAACSNFAFSSVETGVTTEDFGWVFRNCAVVSNESTEAFINLWEGQRKVYTICFQPEYRLEKMKYKDERNYNIYDGVAGEDHIGTLLEMLDMMEETGAILHIISKSVGNKDRSSGGILLSLPDALTLRMRTILSVVFPYATVEEVLDLQNEYSEIPTEYIMRGMTGLLSVLMYKEARKQEESESGEGCPEEQEENDWECSKEQEESDWECSEEADAGSDCAEDIESISIDEMDLSVRAYNCLRRAGVQNIGQLIAMSEDEVAHIRNLGRRSFEEVKSKLVEITQSPDPFSPAPALTELPATMDYGAMLDELIGLAEVKEQVRKICAFGKMKKEMAERGEKVASVSLNMEFVGNPGTAKTTVARIMAGIFHEEGILPSSEVVEVGRADLVAKYVGHTADKVKSVFQQARGKLLFIDEAYSLVEKWKGEFGDEAINTIVQEMENNREDTIVIFAGYPDKMEGFFDRNPGLRSRVPFRISFCDYSTDEMIRIVELEAGKRGFAIQPQAREKIRSICESALGEAEAGNGRFCRNLVENAVLEYAVRVYGHREEAGREVKIGDGDFVLTASDFSDPTTFRTGGKQMVMGFSL